MFGYLAFYNGHKIEIKAPTLYAAKCEAIRQFQALAGQRKKVKDNLVTVVLCERPDGSQVTHTPE